MRLLQTDSAKPGAKEQLPDAKVNDLGVAPCPSSSSTSSSITVGRSRSSTSRLRRFTFLPCLGSNSLFRRRRSPPDEHSQEKTTGTMTQACCSAHSRRGITNQNVNNTLILDLRDPASFRAAHIPRAINTPLPNLKERLRIAEGDLFGDAEGVYAVWNAAKDLLDGHIPSSQAGHGQDRVRKEAFSLPALLEDAKKKSTKVVVLCYDGEASRLVTALLRKRGLEGLSVKGGVEGVREALESGA